ncbi:hypothetical protein SteCoe_8250 [Stentor coeruleus]|uniref:G-protein coupled receptors family 2 profile 2 domain-containing protein n=1 Tax=Stentor coeruleus TaxID=5963 RepID=A0A1R2CKS8_9CILI|nr:hypothetical protein SteCoe_8250 [Stentor coeruleus]
MMPYVYGYEYCQIQGYLLSYFGLSSILWCAFIAHAISLTIFHQKDITLYEWKYLFIGFVLPLLTFLVLFDIKEYQISLGWCWIRQTGKVNEEFYIQIFYRMICYYIPLTIVLIYIFIQHFRVIAHIKRSEIFKMETRKLGQAMIMKLKLYPLVMIGCLFPVILIRLMSLRETPGWYFTLLGGIGIGLNGFFNSIIYGLTQEVKHELSRSIFKHKDNELLTIDDQSENILE